MKESQDNVVDLDTERRLDRGGGGNGVYLDRITEIDKRLVRIETLMGSVAKSEDISNVKIWFLIGVISAIGIAVPAAIGVGFLAARVALLLPG